jgi:aspartate/methionine/tyrosine aminotransferase
MAESVGAMVLCDEAYRWLQIPGEPELAPPMFNLGAAGISVGTVSKPFGLPGLRIGWIAAPKEIIAKCWATRDYTSLSPGKLNDALAILAIKHREKIVARNNSIISANIATTQRWVAKHADILTWRSPKAGLLSLLHYKLDISSMDLANMLANEYSVMLAPGSVFGFENYLRLGVGQQPDIFAQGLEITSECLNKLRK